MSTSGKVYELFRVKRNDGKVTTVSVDPVLVTKACQLMKDPKAVSKLVRDAAFNYEKDEINRSCSGFVTSHLREAISYMQKHKVSTYGVQTRAQ
jgi:hypothetical protein